MVLCRQALRLHKRRHARYGTTLSAYAFRRDYHSDVRSSLRGYRLLLSLCWHHSPWLLSPMEEVTTDCGPNGQHEQWNLGFLDLRRRLSLMFS